MDPHDTDGSAEDPATPRDGGTAPRPPFPPPPGPPPAAAPGTPGASWTPPDAGAATARRAERDDLEVEVEDAEGPPIPPPVRRRRRRRRSLLAAAVLLVVGVPVGLAVSTVFDTGELPSASSGEGSSAETEGPDGDGSTDDPDGPTGSGDPDDDVLGPPDLETLAGADAVYGRLLVDIDVSEQVMMAFQDEVGQVFSAPAESPEELLATLQDLGAEGRDELLEVRDRFDDELEVDGAETIRDRYLEHLDSWADYMDAVSEDPSVLGGEGAGGGYTVTINATADAFARALEDELPEDADASVRAYAEDILDRGFRGSADAQV